MAVMNILWRAVDEVGDEIDIFRSPGAIDVQPFGLSGSG